MLLICYHIRSYTMSDAVTLTYEWFRSRGFRLDSSHVDHHPHMVLILDQHERAIEVSPSDVHQQEFLVWLRSDMAHSRCRFIFARRACWSSQIESLYAGLTDRKLMEVQWDRTQFAESLEFERAECLRRCKEYQHGVRYSRIPG